MNNDFRQRVFLPVILPLGVIVGFFGFAFMLSRVLLAVAEMASTAIAIGLAAYILAIAAVVSSRPRITSRALAVGVSLGLVGVVAAGLIAAGAGMREIEHLAAEEEGGAGAEGEPAGAGGGAPAPEATAASSSEEGQLEFVAVDIDFESAPETATAGAQTVTLTNNGAAMHNVTFPDLDDAPIVEAAGGETASGEITLEPGTYEFICSVPGHETLMNGELTVE
jgi:plastocyanin